MKESRVYQIVIVVLATLFLMMFTKMNENCYELLEINEGLFQVIDENKKAYNDNLEMMQSQYEELEQKYANLLVEHDRLSLQYNALDTFTDEEMYMLAQCVEAEAGTPSISTTQSQKYITQVILNRLISDDFPSTLEEVIYQKNDGVPQFSVAYDGSLEECEPKAETFNNIYSVLVYGTDLPSYVKYFYSSKVEENWVCTLNTYTTTGGTVFAYSDKDLEGK